MRMSYSNKGLEVKYDPEFIVNYIFDCIFVDKGYPRFIYKIAWKELPKGELIITCVDFDGNHVMPSYRIKDVPETLRNIIEEEWYNVPEWMIALSAIAEIDEDVIKNINEKLGIKPKEKKLKEVMLSIVLGENLVKLYDREMLKNRLPKEKVMEIIERSYEKAKKQESTIKI